MDESEAIGIVAAILYALERKQSHHTARVDTCIERATEAIEAVVEGMDGGQSAKAEYMKWRELHID